ncbi:MAG: hypothetical protein K9J42_08480 [Sulfuritalea sp.]|nr:hypothetical protein [Sulfuritalea sp.]
MTDRVVCVSTLAIGPGARLAQSVRRADGAVLLHAGAEVDVDQLRLLIQRGIDCVHVLQEETRDVEQIKRDVETAAARVAYLFRGDGGTERQALAATIENYRRQAAA